MKLSWIAGICFFPYYDDEFLGAVELKIRPHDFPRMLPQVTSTTTATPLPPDVMGPDDTIPEDPWSSRRNTIIPIFLST